MFAAGIQKKFFIGIYFWVESFHFNLKSDEGYFKETSWQ
jgi:hypothetical protein